MPELPEVETIRRDLLAKVVNKQVVSVEILSNKSAHNPVAFFRRNLIGYSFFDIKRRGKLLIFNISSDKHLLIHLKMTGQLIYVDKKTRLAGGHKLNEGDFVQAVGGELPNRFTRVVIEFKDKSKLFFNDMRKFGYLKIVDETELSRLLNNNYGIEPLTDDYTWNNFKDIFKNRRTSVKALLLNQKVIAGLGNIYVDEALFLSGVRPNRKTNSLKEVEKKILFRMIRQVIKRAIDYRGTTFKDYTDSEGKKGNFSKLLKVYGREGEECCKCKRGIKKIRLAGRGTHYCSYCQK